MAFEQRYASCSGQSINGTRAAQQGGRPLLLIRADRTAQHAANAAHDAKNGPQSHMGTIRTARSSFRRAAKHRVFSWSSASLSRFGGMNPTSGNLRSQRYQLLLNRQVRNRSNPVWRGVCCWIWLAFDRAQVRVAGPGLNSRLRRVARVEAVLELESEILDEIAGVDDAQPVLRPTNHWLPDCFPRIARGFSRL